jgi:hypothetical protein
MKKIKEGKERDWYLVDEWKTASGLTARVLRCIWRDDLKKLAPIGLHDFYTGYIQVPAEVTPDENKLDVHGGVTFSLGKLDGCEGEWIGFDTAHYGDEDMQSVEYVKEECEKLAAQVSPQGEEKK